jgi:hypothetical protein
MKVQATFKHGICVGCTIVLLVAVMSSPIRPTRSDISSSPDRLRRNFAVPTAKSKSARMSVRPAASARVQIKALPSENEEELRGTADSTTHLTDLPPTPSPKSAQATAAHGSISAPHPLRC